MNHAPEEVSDDHERLEHAVNVYDDRLKRAKAEIRKASFSSDNTAEFEDDDADVDEDEDEEEEQDDGDVNEDEGTNHCQAVDNNHTIKEGSTSSTPVWNASSIARLLKRMNVTIVDDASSLSVNDWPGVADCNNGDFQCDALVQQELLDWERVAFAPFSAAECKRKWTEASKELRLYRNLSELVEEMATNHGVNLNAAPATASGDAMTNEENIEVDDAAEDDDDDEQTTSAARRYGATTRSALDIPAKPQTALQLFVASVRDKLEKQSKSRKITASAYSHIVKSWKTHPEAERIVFIRRAMEYWRDYERKMIEYKKHNPRYKAFQCTVTKEERALLDKVNGKPAKPAGSAYVLFLQDTLPTLKRHVPKNRMSIVSRMWSDLPEDERAVYYEKFNKLKLEYRDACIKYKYGDSSSASAPEAASGESIKRKADNETPPVLTPSLNNDGAPPGFALFSKMAAPLLKIVGGPSAHDDDDVLAEMWRKLTPEEKQMYASATAAPRRCDGSGGVAEAKIEVHPRTSAEEEAKARQRIARQLLSGAPKKPPSCAYHLFLRDSYPKLTDLPQKERTRLLAKTWTNLPSEAKRPFVLRTAEMQKTYEVEFTDFLESIPAETREMVRKEATGTRRRATRNRTRGGKRRKLDGDDDSGMVTGEQDEDEEGEDCAEVAASVGLKVEVDEGVEMVKAEFSNSNDNDDTLGYEDDEDDEEDEEGGDEEGGDEDDENDPEGDAEEEEDGDDGEDEYEDENLEGASPKTSEGANENDTGDSETETESGEE